MGGHLAKNVVIAASLVAAGFVAAWIRFSPHLGTEGAFTDGERTIPPASIEALRYAIWDAPEPLPGALNSNETERAPAVSPDGRRIVFVVGERGLGADLWIADLDARGEPTDPRPLAGLNTAADEVAPAFAPDGALLFASNRAGGRGGLDLWWAPGGEGLFGAPRPLGSGVNTQADETDPAPVPGTGEVVFASNRADRGAPRRRDFDLHVAFPDPTSTDPRADGTTWVTDALEGVNSEADERDPALTRDGRALLFASDRGGASFDLLRATRAPLDRSSRPAAGRRWLAPEPLAGLNSSADERDPQPTADGFALFFARGEPAAGDAGAVDWDVWRARSSELARTPGRPIGWRELFFLVSLLLLALLAALAKRWRGLDIIYKAFLVSLIAHAALLWWTREVVPESEVVEFADDGEGTRVRLRIVEDPDSTEARRSRERAGEVEARRVVSPASDAAPAVAEALVASPRELAGPAAATSAAAIERARAEAAPAPERLAAAPERADPSGETARRADLNAPSVEVARRAADAPELGIAEPTPAAAAAPRARMESREVEVHAGALAASRRSPAAATPMSTAAAAADVARAAPSAPPVEAPTRQRVELDRTADAGAASAPAQPIAGGERVAAARRAAEAREAALTMSAAGAAGVARGAASAAEDAAERAPAAARAEPRALASGPCAPTSRADVALGAAGAGGSAAAPARQDAPRPERRGALALPGARVALPSEAAATRRSGATGAPEFDALEGALAAAPIERAIEDGAPGAPAPVAPAPMGPAGGGSAAARDDSTAAAPALAAAAPLRRTRPGEAAPDFAGPPPAAFAGPRRGAPAQAAGAPDLAAPDGDLAAASPRPTAIEASARRAAPGVTPGAFALEPAAEPAPIERGSRTIGDAAADAPERFAGAAPARPLSDAPAPRLARLAAPTQLAADDIPAPTVRQTGDWDRTPYQSRTGDRKVAALREYGGSEATEEAVRGGLAYLASRQRADGSFGSPRLDRDKYGRTAVGKTGLAALAFMGAGHTPTSNTEYSSAVERGLRALVGQQDRRTGHFGLTNAYSHSIATYALGEAYALTGAEWLREPLERAVARILRHQIKSPDARFHGGWSYYLAGGFAPRERVDLRWPRVSVTVWQVMALESANLGGVPVEDVVFERAEAFLRNAWDQGQGAFRYSHDPSRLRSSYPILPGSTPAALFGLSLLGEDVSGRIYRDARAFVMARAPDGYRFTNSDAFVYRAQANLYFWYYGTLAMFRAGGDDWRRWNAAMKETLLSSQDEDGSWAPISIYAEYAGDTEDDRIYTTCMNVLALEIYYRYFTPLLEVE